MDEQNAFTIEENAAKESIAHEICLHFPDQPQSQVDACSDSIVRRVTRDVGPMFEISLEESTSKENDISPIKVIFWVLYFIIMFTGIVTVVILWLGLGGYF